MSQRVQRRTFLKGAVGAGLGATGAVLARLPGAYAIEVNRGSVVVGEGVVDTTPPLGIEMGGFHRAPGNERRIVGVRQATAVRALVLQRGDVETAVISLDLAATADDVARRIQRQVEAETGIPAANVRVCSTHTHSMPAFCYLRQWGAIPTDFMALVEKKVVEAVKLAKADLAPAKLMVGKSRAVGGNFNRTSATYKTDEKFGPDSTDAERWLDTMLHVLYFERSGGKRNLLWYHFSAHPVCYADEQSGPDWPGLVHNLVGESHHAAPSFLQGHAGDVNPGSGDPWRGDAEQTAKAVHKAISDAMNGLVSVDMTELRSRTDSHPVAFDMAKFSQWLNAYRDDPAKCTGGPWVDAGFAKDWYEGNRQREQNRDSLPVALSAIQLGDVGFIFHPSELYSYYGLAIRHSSSMAHTIVVGYTDGIIGYLTDPAAYASEEYAAVTVPKILDFPPFAPTAAAQLTEAAGQLLKRTVG